jgi:hypothetical protein
MRKRVQHIHPGPHTVEEIPVRRKQPTGHGDGGGERRSGTVLLLWAGNPDKKRFQPSPPTLTSVTGTYWQVLSEIISMTGLLLGIRNCGENTPAQILSGEDSPAHASLADHLPGHVQPQHLGREAEVILSEGCVRTVGGQEDIQLDCS